MHYERISMGNQDEGFNKKKIRKPGMRGNQKRREVTHTGNKKNRKNAGLQEPFSGLRHSVIKYWTD